MNLAGANAYGDFSNSEAVNYLEQETGMVCKILFQDPNKGDQS